LQGGIKGPRYVWPLLLVKNHKIADCSTAAKAKEKISKYLESFKFAKKTDVHLTKFKNNQILLNKISHKFLVTTKLFTRKNIPIQNLKKCAVPLTQRKLYNIAKV
jgi:hypothetical protein